MKGREFAVMQKLIDCATLYNLNRTFGSLAYFLLLNYNSLETLTIKNITESCFVSASSVRRFCQSIGFDNFSDLVAAKLNNPENQQNIAYYNWRKGRYDVRMLHHEINDIIFSVSRTVSKAGIRRLARDIVRMKTVILFCVRPYSLWFREFQNQMIALGKPLYILEEVTLWKPMIEKLGKEICSIVVSPAAQMLPALGGDIASVPGPKTLVVCGQKMCEPEYRAYLGVYDSILSAKLKIHDYEYLELFGKYAVSFLFEIVMGEVIGILQKGDAGGRRGDSPGGAEEGAP